MALAQLTTTFDRLPPPLLRPVEMPRVASAAVADWRTGLPVLVGPRLTLRELRTSDAPALLALLTTEEVTRFISPPPTTVEGFERFIAWANAQRAAGQYICFAIVPRGFETAIGIIQVRQLAHGFEIAEWGFAVGEPFWGTGLFVEAAELVLSFSFETVGVCRLEARAAKAKGRGNGALRKLGACCEATLHQSFSRGGRYLDQCLWSILAEDWRRAKAVWGPRRVSVAATDMRSAGLPREIAEVRLPMSGFDCRSH